MFNAGHQCCPKCCPYAFAAPFISVSSSLSTLTVTYADRRTHVHRPTYARTPHAARTYTARRTSSLSLDGNAETMFRSHCQSVFSCS